MCYRIWWESYGLERCRSPWVWVTRESGCACATKSRVDRYTYRAEWSPHYNEYVGVCVELPYLRREAPTAPEAVAAIQEALVEHLHTLRACGDPIPAPLSERSYSGTFSVRTSPELHARLALEAIEQGVSMNQWIVQKLSGRAPSSTFGLSGFD